MDELDDDPLALELDEPVLLEELEPEPDADEEEDALPLADDDEATAR